MSIYPTARKEKSNANINFISFIISAILAPANTNVVALTADITIVKSNIGVSKTGIITSLCLRLDETAEMILPKETKPIVPIITIVKRAGKSGISTGKKTKNINNKI